MCDYSLENQISRTAEVGDKLVTSSFPMTPARGFSTENEAGVEVCVRPATELAFERLVRYSGHWSDMVNYIKARLGYDMADAILARFRQVDLDNPHTHHDAIEMADGRIIKLPLLHDGQCARVLQLPGQPDHVHHHEHSRATAPRKASELTPAR